MPNQPLHILLIEDNEADAHLVEAFLEQALSAPFTLAHAARLSEGLCRLRRDPPDIVVLDLDLPDSLGLESFRVVQAQADHVPIVVLSGADDEDAARAAVRMGAHDYLVKGRTDSYLLARSLLFSIERAVRVKQAQTLQVTITPELIQISDRLKKLTPREREVLEQIADGKSLKQVALASGTSYYTVKNQRASILDKLGANSDADLVRMVLLTRFGKEPPSARPMNSPPAP